VDESLSKQAGYRQDFGTSHAFDLFGQIGGVQARVYLGRFPQELGLLLRPPVEIDIVFAGFFREHGTSERT
jgi:hypothetical protein